MRQMRHLRQMRRLRQMRHLRQVRQARASVRYRSGLRQMRHLSCRIAGGNARLPKRVAVLRNALVFVDVPLRGSTTRGDDWPSTSLSTHVVTRRNPRFTSMGRICDSCAVCVRCAICVRCATLEFAAVFSEDCVKCAIYLVELREGNVRLPKRATCVSTREGCDRCASTIGTD